MTVTISGKLRRPEKLEKLVFKISNPSKCWPKNWMFAYEGHRYPSLYLNFHSQLPLEQGNFVRAGKN